MSTHHTVGDVIGVPCETTCVLDAGHAARFAAAVESPLCPQDGEPLPFLWHWGWFVPTVPSADLGPDGQPRLPPTCDERSFPRRMWAASTLRATKPFVVGRRVIRRSTLTSVAEKSGRSGALLVVDLRHDYLKDGTEALTEMQTLIYRAATDGATGLPEGDFVPPVEEGGWRDAIRLGPVDLFRFSSVTFNSHRIHYDAPYAHDVEGYPRLVVHGPLIAVLLAASAQRATGSPIAAMSFRAEAPLFADLPFTILGRRAGGNRAVVSAVRNDARTAMTVELELSSATD